MKNLGKLLLLLAAFVLVVGGAGLLYDRLAPQVETDQLGNASDNIAPDFTVYDAAGNPVTLSEHFGKPIVLNFWASWCGPCQSEMPDFQKVWEELGDQVVFMMINMTDGTQETQASAEAFLKEKGYSFPVYFDTNLEAAGTYGAYSLPTSYFIAADGTPVTYATGAISESLLRQGIEMVIGNEAP